MTIQQSAIVTLIDGVPTTTSLAIADGAELQHKNVLELIRTYLADLEEFGRVAFKTRPRLAGQHGGGNVVDDIFQTVPPDSPHSDMPEFADSPSPFALLSAPILDLEYLSIPETSHVA